MFRKISALILSLIFTFTFFSLAIGNYYSEKESDGPKRTLLISIDGLRQDAVQNTEYGKYLIENFSYSLEVTTVNPSVTLPCHMSMFHSVSPEKHGVNSNVYTPSDELGDGIAETVFGKEMSAAIFYNWREIGYIVTEGSVSVKEYIPGETLGWEEANRLVGEATVKHIQNAPTDFVFMYLGFLDEEGHGHGWLSEEYYYALNESFSLIEKVITEAKKQNYTVIITSDHGGHDHGHGSDLAEDMTIPLFIVGDGYGKGKNLGKLSILDVAPTVAQILGITPPAYWEGTAIPKSAK